MDVETRYPRRGREMAPGCRRHLKVIFLGILIFAHRQPYRYLTDIRGLLDHAGILTETYLTITVDPIWKPFCGPLVPRNKLSFRLCVSHLFSFEFESRKKRHTLYKFSKPAHRLPGPGRIILGLGWVFSFLGSEVSTRFREFGIARGRNFVSYPQISEVGFGSRGFPADGSLRPWFIYILRVLSEGSGRGLCVYLSGLQGPPSPC